VLSLGKLAAGQQQYYEQEVARGLDEYYSGEKEAPGQWMGQATGRLGLKGEVGSVEFERVLSHQDPATGVPLADGRMQPKVVGFDATFSAPKSVSLLYAIGSPEVSNQVRNAHDAAVTAAFSVLERHAAVRRRGAGGCLSVAGEGLAGAGFRHRTSRAGDPQLHTHVVVANLVRAEADGRWSALDAARGLYPWARPVGHLYEAQLRWELTRRLGVEWGPVRNGIAEVKGMPRSVLEAFSTRRREIRAHLEARGFSSARSAQIATYATRRRKDRPAAAETLFEGWRAKAATLGVDTRSLDRLLGRAVVGPPAVGSRQAALLFEELAAPDGVTAARSTFTFGRLVEAVCDLLPAGGRVGDVLALADEFLASEHVIALEAASGPMARRVDGRPIPGHGGEGRWTTREMLATEQRLLDGVARRLGGQAGTVQHDQVEAVVGRHGRLAEEQVAMVRHVCGSGNGVDVVIGVAGAGKTTALAAAAEAWQQAGYRITGVALAARTARQLHEAAGMEALTMTRLLGRLDRAEFVLGDRDVLVVDEAGMVGTRQLARLLDHAGCVGSKVVLIGDPRQLPELDAGGALRSLQHRTGAITLTTNRRQTEPWERQALGALRHGNPTRALGAYQAHGRVHVAGGPADFRQVMVAAWAHDRLSGEALMLAATRAEVDDLNRRARALLQQTGDVGPDQIVLGSRALAIGDTVLALRNDGGTGLLNGTRARLQAIDDRRHVLVLDTGGATVGVPFRYVEDGHLTHGYAMTIHKAQGATVDSCRVLVGDAMNREQLYTALSRGRAENHLYLEDPDRRFLDRHARELTPTPDQVLQAAILRSGAQELAAEHDGDRRIPVAVLRAEQDRLRHAIAGQPPDPRPELEALAEKHHSLRRLLADAKAAKDDSQRQLDDLGPMSRLLHRDRRAALEQRLDVLSSRIDQHTNRLSQLQNRRDHLQPALARWRDWHADHKPDLDRLTELNLHIGIAEAVQRARINQPGRTRTSILEVEAPEIDLGR
jgi:conjugative relaxase-like TrwC/TraI family protein